MAARNLSLVLTASGAVANSLPASLNRAGKEVQRLQGRAAALRAELAQQSITMKQVTRGSDEYRRAAQRATEVRAELGGLGDQLKEATVRQRRFNERVSVGKDLLVKSGIALGAIGVGYHVLSNFTNAAAADLHTLDVLQASTGVSAKNLNRNVEIATVALRGDRDAALSATAGHGQLYKSLQLLDKGYGGFDYHLSAIAGINPHELAELSAPDLRKELVLLIKDYERLGKTQELAALNQLFPDAFTGYLAQARLLPEQVQSAIAAADKEFAKQQQARPVIEAAGVAKGEAAVDRQAAIQEAGVAAAPVVTQANKSITDLIRGGTYLLGGGATRGEAPPDTDLFAGPQPHTRHIENLVRDVAGLRIPGLEGDLGTQVENLGRDFAGFKIPFVEGDLGTQVENLGRDFAGFKIPFVEGDLGTQFKNLISGGAGEQRSANLPPVEPVASGGFFRNLFGGGPDERPNTNLPPVEPVAQRPIYDEAPSVAAPVYPIYGPFPVPGQAGGGADAPAPVAAAPTPPSSDTYTIYITGTTDPEETADLVLRRLEERAATSTYARGGGTFF